MQEVKKIFSIFVVFYLIFLGSCQEASLWEPNKYKRNNDNFDKVVTNRNEVVICTTGASRTSRLQAQEKAKKECAKFGKKAVYQNYSVATCPLSKPVSWHYDCTAP